MLSRTAILAAVLSSLAIACAAAPAEEEGTDQASSELRNDPCAVVRCMEGTHCEARGRIAECVADAVDPCAAVLCVEGTVCVSQGGRPRCVAP